MISPNSTSDKHRYSAPKQHTGAVEFSFKANLIFVNLYIEKFDYG